MVNFFYKKSILHLSLFFIITCAHAQVIDKKVISDIMYVDSLFELSAFEKAIPRFLDIEKRNIFPKNKIFLKVSKSYYSLGNKDSALYYLKKSIESGKRYFTVESIKSDEFVSTVLSVDSSDYYVKLLEYNTNRFSYADSLCIYKNFADSLKHRKELDRKYRTLGRAASKEEWSHQKFIDSCNMVFLLNIIDSIKCWPGFLEVGKKGESASFLIAQHSEDSILQQYCLALMQTSMANNNIDPSHYAYLTDRYLLNKYNYQLFGTQIEMISVNETMVAVPKMKDKMNLNVTKVLRSYFSMPTLDYYLNEMTKINTKK